MKQWRVERETDIDLWKSKQTLDNDFWKKQSTVESKTKSIALKPKQAPPWTHYCYMCFYGKT